MSATQTPRNINDLFEAGKNAKENPYVQRLVHDEELRENAIAAFTAARSAFERASSKNWDKNKLAGDKKLRKDLQKAVAGLKDTREELVAPKKHRHPLRKLVLVAIVGGAVALVVNEDIRKKVLDTLFGAEEEFEYKSTTTSTNGAA
jgi:hypothetical protein